MIKFFSRMTGLCVMLACLITVGSVYASFHYAVGPPEDIESLFQIHMASTWVLPDDKETGESHQSLLEEIINGSDGLNTKSSYLNDQIASRKRYDRETFSNNDFWQGSTASSTFETETSNLTFLLYFPDNPNTTQDESEQEMYVFTTAVYLGESSFLSNPDTTVPIGDYVYAIYRTRLINIGGQWIAQETELGAAPSMLYQNSLAGSWLSRNPSFDPAPTKWLSGKRGTTYSNAIYTYVHPAAGKDSNGNLFTNIDGYTTSTHVADSTSELVYYRYTAESTKTYTLKVKGNITVSVYNNLYNPINTTVTTASDYTTIKFSATRNTLYYIVMSGSEKTIYTFY